MSAHPVQTRKQLFHQRVAGALSLQRGAADSEGEHPPTPLFWVTFFVYYLVNMESSEKHIFAPGYFAPPSPGFVGSMRSALLNRLK